MPSISRKQRVWLLLFGLAIFALLTHSAYRTLSQRKEVQSAQNTGTPWSKGGRIEEDFSLEPLQGKRASFSSMEGKVVLINFWAGWCAPCIQEMPDLYELQKRYGAKGFEVLAVNMDDDPLDGMKILRKHVGEPPFPIYRGVESGLADRFNVMGLPFTVIVDRGRGIRYAKGGYADWASPEATKMIESLL